MLTELSQNQLVRKLNLKINNRFNTMIFDILMYVPSDLKVTRLVTLRIVRPTATRTLKPHKRKTYEKFGYSNIIGCYNRF